MLQWSKELSVPFDDVYDWFQKKWKGKIEYEYQKAKQKEEMGNNPDRSRAVKSFEPTTDTWEWKTYEKNNISQKCY